MNILLVTIDCLRRDRCGIYGHHRNTTPTLDALAQEAHVFENAYATGPVTTESFPGILAGRLSTQCAAGGNLYQKRVPDGEPTLATHLHDRGYDTIGVISNPRIGSHVDTDRGFEIFKNLRTGDKSTEDENILRLLLPDLQVGERLYQLRERMRNHDPVPYRYKTPFMGFRTYQYLTGWPSVRGTRVVEEFLDELAEASGRFFAWTHLMDVHGPIHPQSVAESEFVTSGILSQFQSHAKRVSDVCDMTTEARYDSAVQHVDSQIQRIINWLQSSNLWEETTLIVTADHGDALYDRGIYGHPQHYLYDELLSVPLIIRVPGRDGSRISQSFSLGWLHEIVTELTELPRMNVPLSSAEEQTHLKNSSKDSIIIASSASHQGQSIVTRYQGQKYIKQVGELSGDELRVSQPGLYNLELDPGERNPTQDTVTTLERAAESIEIEEPEVLRSRGKQTSITESTKDRLKQLGYAE